MITCYFGKLGQGKTYALAEHALRELNDGRVVYANFHIEWHGRKAQRFPHFDEIPASNYRPFHSVDEFLTMENAFVALDEGWIYFDSYDMTKLPLHIRMKILQSRKDGLDIAYTSQRPEQVHKALRAMTNEYYECVAGRIPFMKVPVFYRYNADLVGDTVKRMKDIGYEQRPTADGGSQWVPFEKEQRPSIIWPSKKVFNSFDTSEKIAITSEKGLAHAPRMIYPQDTHSVPDL